MSPDGPTALASRPSAIFDPEEVLFGQQLVELGLVDPADDGGLLLAVTDALGQRKRRDNDVKQAGREEGAYPSRIVQIADADDRDRE